jgi:hypothetical protein
MAILVINYGIIKSINILPTVIRLMIKFDADIPRDCFRQEVKWTLAIRLQLSTLSVLDLDNVYHLPPAPRLEEDTYCPPAGNQ